MAKAAISKSCSDLGCTRSPRRALSTVCLLKPVCLCRATAGYGGFACVSLLSSGGLQTSYSTPAESATVTLSSPITITGTAMGLLLDLQVSQSATFSSCDLQGATSTITPTFNLIPFAISLQPTKSGKWQSDGIDGQTSSLSTSRNAFSMVTADGAKLSVNTSSSTVYQGGSFGDSGI